jgi:hypothetical protein
VKGLKALGSALLLAGIAYGIFALLVFVGYLTLLMITGGERA